eukprot:1491596-Rhodomonas_salina.9
MSTYTDCSTFGGLSLLSELSELSRSAPDGVTEVSEFDGPGGYLVHCSRSDLSRCANEALVCLPGSESHTFKKCEPSGQGLHHDSLTWDHGGGARCSLSTSMRSQMPRSRTVRRAAHSCMVHGVAQERGVKVTIATGTGDTDTLASRLQISVQIQGLRWE